VTRRTDDRLRRSPRPVKRLTAHRIASSASGNRQHDPSSCVPRRKHLLTSSFVAAMTSRSGSGLCRCGRRASSTSDGIGAITEPTLQPGVSRPQLLHLSQRRPGARTNMSSCPTSRQATVTTVSVRVMSRKKAKVEPRLPAKLLEPACSPSPSYVLKCVFHSEAVSGSPLRCQRPQAACYASPWYWPDPCPTGHEPLWWRRSELV
jgi:hypothetical protein